MKKAITLALLLITVLSGWLAYSKIRQSRRNAAYHAAIGPFLQDLPVGMPRADVEKYLRLRSVKYHAINNGETYLIKIGEESPGNLWCEPWIVNIAIEFDSSDTLRDVHIRKFGTCL
jgi:hypothetical protein